MHTAELVILEPSSFNVDSTTEKFKKYK